MPSSRPTTPGSKANKGTPVHEVAAAIKSGKHRPKKSKAVKDVEKSSSDGDGSPSPESESESESEPESEPESASEPESTPSSDEEEDVKPVKAKTKTSKKKSSRVKTKGKSDSSRRQTPKEGKVRSKKVPLHKTLKEANKKNGGLPKRVNIRITIGDYNKLLKAADALESLKNDKECKKAMSAVFSGEDLSYVAFMGLLTKLPLRQTNLAKPYVEGKKTSVYFTDPHPTNRDVKNLFRAVPEIEDRLSLNPMKETCPSDVRVMFYAYIRKKDLVSKEERDIRVDDFLSKIAPDTLKDIKAFPCKDAKTVWKICTEIRGIEGSKTKAKAKDDTSQH